MLQNEFESNAEKCEAWPSIMKLNEERVHLNTYVTCKKAGEISMATRVRKGVGAWELWGKYRERSNICRRKNCGFHNNIYIGNMDTESVIKKKLGNV